MARPFPSPIATEDPSTPRERLRGTVLRLTYQNAENDYRVVKLLPESDVSRERIDPRGEVVLVGQLPGIEVGFVIEAEGTWTAHPQYGPQFKADWFKPSLPTGRRGIEAYLGSGAIKGVGKVIAKRIVEALGEETLEILDRDISRLGSVKGMNRVRLAAIEKSWRESRGDRELITFLGDHGIAPSWAGRLRRAYGDAALSVVRSNPYRLAGEVRGVGFTRADAMARGLGISADSPERIEAALAHVLEGQAGEGHTFQPKGALVEQATQLLDLEVELVEPRAEAMIQRGDLRMESIGEVEAIFLNRLQKAERECASHLARLARTRRAMPGVEAATFIEHFERRARIQLAPAQRDAVAMLAREGSLVLTGGPGTGKTTTLRAAIEMAQAAGWTVRLAAPTGRAARRLAEASHAKAETIHRLLGYQAHLGTFAHDDSRPIETDLLVVDEASMLDAQLARDLFSALRGGTSVLVVGDEDQLPSVGPGNVLGDLIASRLFPVVRLNEIFRQAEASLIVVNAHRVNRGEFPIVDPPAGTEAPDFFFIERDEPADIAAAIRTLVSERIRARFKLDPIRDVQILSPMRKGELGVVALNRDLQRILNPNAKIPGGIADFDEFEDGEKTRFRPGDRVMQVVNDYDKDVSNGDVGRVVSIDGDAGEMIVQFDRRSVSYLADELGQLSLAYAVTIHKSQGSEYPAVVIPLHTQHWVMLQRNLLYTAITRGRRLVCVVGSRKALWMAVRNAQRRVRNTGLRYFLSEKR